MKSIWKWLHGNYRGMKAVYYKREVLAVRLSDAIPANYLIVKGIFTGCFGNATFECSDLLIAYKILDRKITEDEYTKINKSITHMGFNLIISSNGDTTVVGVIPEPALFRYMTNKSVGISNSNIDSLSYLT